MNRFALASVAAVMAAGMAAPVAAQDAAGAAAVYPARGTVLEITAEGRTTRVPDLATIRAGVVTQAASAAEALSANATRMAAVLAALKRAGVADRDVQTAQIALAPQYRYGENVPPVITGYQATNSVTIRFRKIAASGSILDALVQQGANQIDGPTLGLDQPDAALDEARRDAMRQARARADLYAQAAGMKVARILTISENGASLPPSPMPVIRMAAARASADTQVAAGEQEVTVPVTVRFLLD
jgi:uncharacterized protein